MGITLIVFDATPPRNPCEYPHKKLLCKNDVSAVQGHPKSLILIPIESACATSFNPS